MKRHDKRVLKLQLEMTNNEYGNLEVTDSLVKL